MHISKIRIYFHISQGKLAKLAKLTAYPRSPGGFVALEKGAS